MVELKKQVIEALRSTNSWASDACIKLFETCDDPTKVVIPVSMLTLMPVVNLTLKGDKQ